MKVSIFIKISGQINSRELWELIEHFGVHLTDCITETLVYGDCYMETASRVVYHCALYGDINVTLTHIKDKEAE